MNCCQNIHEFRTKLNFFGKLRISSRIVKLHRPEVPFNPKTKQAKVGVSCYNCGGTYRDSEILIIKITFPCVIDMVKKKKKNEINQKIRNSQTETYK